MNVLNLDTGKLHSPVREDGKAGILDENRLQNALIGMDPCNDVFDDLGNGRFRVRESSKILAGHFKGMPVVPWVLIKRLFAKHMGTESYAKEIRKHVWTFDFLQPLLPWASTYFRQDEQDGIALVSEGKIIARAMRTFINDEWHMQDPVQVLSCSSRLARLSDEQLDEFLLQTAPFRFVEGADFANADGIRYSQNSEVFYGRFHVPQAFHLVQPNGIVFPEIVEEMIAQIGSVAISRRINHAEKVGKREVLTFDQSVVWRYYEALARNDTLSMIGRIMVDSENPRRLGFRYNAFNSDHYPVMCGEIWGKRVPLAVLKRHFHTN